MCIGGLPHKLYFITLTLQEKIIIGPTKKIVTSYVVGDLALLLWQPLVTKTNRDTNNKSQRQISL